MAFKQGRNHTIMPRLKFAYTLPVLFCVVGGLLWYWQIHSGATIPNMFGWSTPASFISEGLFFPAVLVGIVIFMPFRGIMPQGAVQSPLAFLLVAGMWYSIGSWFDHRRQVNDISKPKGLLSSAVLPSLVLICGVITLVYSLARAQSLHISNFIQTIYIALLQTWAVCLIGIPAVAIVRYLLETRRKKHSSGSASRPRTRIRNFRLFELIFGVFVILLILWYPYGPFFRK